jgi:hypothetical protein
VVAGVSVCVCACAPREWPGCGKSCSGICDFGGLADAPPTTRRLPNPSLSPRDDCDHSVVQVVDAVREEAGLGRRVVMVTPASPNYEFGGEQLRVLNGVRRAFPSVVADIFSVGHCLFG